MLNGRV